MPGTTTPEDCPGLEHCADAAPIHQQLAELRAGVRILASGHEQLAHQMAEVTVTLHRHEEQLAGLSTLPAAVAENTAVTKEIKDLLIAGRVTGRITAAIGRAAVKVAAVVTALAGAWWAVKNGGPKP